MIHGSSKDVLTHALIWIDINTSRSQVNQVPIWTFFALNGVLDLALDLLDPESAKSKNALLSLECKSKQSKQSDNSALPWLL